MRGRRFGVGPAPSSRHGAAATWRARIAGDDACAAPLAPKVPMTPIQPRPRAVLRHGGLSALALALFLSACAQPGGPKAALPGDDDGDAARLVVSAGGRDVIVAPPPGFCIDRDAVRDQGDAVFVLIEDCTQIGAVPASNEAALVNGLVTLSIGAAPLFDGTGADRRAASERLERFLRSDEGRATVGMGGGPDDITIVESRRFEGSLFLLVEDASSDAAPVLSPRLWRAFTELNDRAAIAALSVFESSAIGDATMLAHLARVVAALKMANGGTVGPREAQLALAAPRPTSRPVRTASGKVAATPAAVPLPAQRPAAAGPDAVRAALPDAPAPAADPVDATGQAPSSAPRSVPRAKRS